MTERAIVRTYAPATDRDEIVALAFEFGGYLAWKDPRKIIVRDDEFGERLVAEIEREAQHIVVAVVGDRVGGFAAAAITPPAGRILHLSVGGRFSGAGAGRALYDALAPWLRDNGATSIEADALAANDTARAFYESLGFEPRTVSFLKLL